MQSETVTFIWVLQIVCLLSFAPSSAAFRFQAYPETHGQEESKPLQDDKDHPAGFESAKAVQARKPEHLRTWTRASMHNLEDVSREVSTALIEGYSKLVNDVVRFRRYEQDHLKGVPTEYQVVFPLGVVFLLIVGYMLVRCWLSPYENVSFTSPTEATLPSAGGLSHSKKPKSKEKPRFGVRESYEIGGEQGDNKDHPRITCIRGVPGVSSENSMNSDNSLKTGDIAGMERQKVGTRDSTETTVSEYWADDNGMTPKETQKALREVAKVLATP